jgi:hypothetical protein
MSRLNFVQETWLAAPPDILGANARKLLEDYEWPLATSGSRPLSPLPSRSAALWVACFREISGPIEKRLSGARRKTRPFSTGLKPRTQIEPARRQHSLRPHDQQRRQEERKNRRRRKLITHEVRFWHKADIRVGQAHVSF